ncbi:MAG: DUF2023 family protein [Paludibacteraceae bacterium]|nr:DUF2023 family protein [Paludibacteraceae bacterium]
MKKKKKMQVLAHHIYEYRKGLRLLVLHTMRAECRETAERKLRANHIHYIIQEVGGRNINIFFGDEQCIEVIRTFVSKPLSHLSPEEDFILGTLLGYDKHQQCERYLKRRNMGSCPQLHIA